MRFCASVPPVTWARLSSACQAAWVCRLVQLKASSGLWLFFGQSLRPFGIVVFRTLRVHGAESDGELDRHSIHIGQAVFAICPMVTWNIHLNDIATVPVALHSFDAELSEYVYRGKEALIAGPAFGLTVNTEVLAFLAMLDPHAVTQRSIAVAQIQQEIGFAVLAPGQAVAVETHPVCRSELASNAVFQGHRVVARFRHLGGFVKADGLRESLRGPPRAESKCPNNR
jgi:hypothetical protein